jgi:Cys-tRNA(Pro)/Cys-tRNA(Cys) deacylase
MSTRAVTFLKRRNVPFELVRYDHREKGAEFAARATGFPLEQTIKTLVVDLGKSNYVLVLMPGHQQLDLKRLAGVCESRRAAMADTKTAERLTGYLVGGISPFGTKKSLAAIMDSSLMGHKEVVINAGRRGIMLKLAPGHVVEALDCRIAAIQKKREGSG